MNGNLQIMRDPRFIMRIKDADETVNNSNVLQNDDDLVVSSLPTGRYAFTMLLRQTGSATADFKFTLAGGTSVFTGLGWYTTNALNIDEFDLTDASVSMLYAGTANVLYVTGYVLCTTAGTFRLQWAQNTADASDTKLLEGSWFSLVKI